MNSDPGSGIRWAALVTASFIVQVAFLNQVSIMGVHPELMLLLAITAGLVAGPERGAAIGFVSGLLIDLTLHGNLGIAAFCYTVVGFLAGMTREMVMSVSRLLSVLIVVVGSAVGVGLYAAVGQLLGEHTMSDPNFGRIVTIVALWNAALSLPVLSLCRRTEGARATL